MNVAATLDTAGTPARERELACVPHPSASGVVVSARDAAPPTRPMRRKR